MKPLKILVVDDNRDAADTLALLLNVLGHEAIAAYDGLEAITASADFLPDCVVMDLDMPRMDGFTAAAHLRDLMGGTLVLAALSGVEPEELGDRVQASRFDLHYTKPLSLAALQGLVQRCEALKSAAPAG